MAVTLTPNRKVKRAVYGTHLPWERVRFVAVVIYENIIIDGKEHFAQSEGTIKM